MPVLEYDPDQRLFFFTRPAGSLPFPGAVMASERDGRRFSFGDFSPKSYFNIQQFKSFYGKDAKATKAAAERAKEISAERESDYVLRYGDLISGTPYEHQLTTINLMQRNDRFALLLEQGLGKTYIALQSFKMFKARDGYLRAIVVCPKVVFQTWIREIEKFAPEFKVLQYRGSLEERRMAFEKCRDFEILLTTYEMIRGGRQRTFDQWNGWAWQMLGRDDRETLVKVMRSKLAKPKILLADETGLDGRALIKWRNACGKVLANANDGYWTAKAYAYSNFHGIEDEWYRMNANVQFELLHDWPSDFFNSLKPNVVVFDEASRLVNPSSKQSEAAEKMKARRKYLMSGTLCVGRPIDMYMPMKVLDPTITNMSWTRFRDKYCYVSRHNRHIITGYKNLDSLKRTVDPYIVEFKRDACLDLPDRTIVSCYYEPDPSVVDMYDKVVCCDTVQAGGRTVNCQLQLQKIQKCMQLLSGFINTANEYRLCGNCSEEAVYMCAMQNVRPGGSRCVRKGEAAPQDEPSVTVEVVPPKSNAKLEMLRTDLEEIVPNEKVIIWYWYTYDYVQIVTLLESMDISYVKATDQDCAAKFEEDGECRVFLGQIVQGVGITLNSATTTIYYSHGLALEPRLQSMDRNMRIGQSKPVVVRDYVCRGSIEESVVALLQHKEDVKDFMQKRVECLSCERMLSCLDNNVKRYGEGCIYHKQMKKAEEKHTLRLETIGDIYGAGR